MPINPSAVQAELQVIESHIASIKSSLSRLEEMEPEISGMPKHKAVSRALDKLITATEKQKKAKDLLHSRLLKFAAENGIPLPRIGT